MELTVKQLATICENPDPVKHDLQGDLEALVPEMIKAGITTEKRVAAFLANVGVETDYLKTLEEYGGKAYWMYLDRHPDGGPGEWRYHGRGYLQVTWSSNYRTLGEAIGVNLIEKPNLLSENKKIAARGAVWYWKSRGLNAYSDRGDFKNVASIINYGSPGHTANHYSDRLRLYNNGLRVLPQGWTLDGKEEQPMATNKTPMELAEEAIQFGMKMVGARYGEGWEEGSWPALDPLYSRITRHDSAAWYRERECICSGFINVVRFEVANLPSLGWKDDDDWPGGTAALWRHYANKPGTREYPPVKDTPRGWLVVSPYMGPRLAFQGHVGIALGNGYVLEARVPTLSKNRTESEGDAAIRRGGARGYERIVPPGGPNGWMVR